MFVNMAIYIYHCYCAHVMFTCTLYTLNYSKHKHLIQVIIKSKGKRPINETSHRKLIYNRYKDIK